MKVKPETALFKVPHGSHLYGTNGPESDEDFKVVCLPSLDTLLLNTKVTNRKVKPSGAGEKQQAGDVETEYVPLQVFMDDFFNGQTYALEIAFAVTQGKYEDLGKVWGNFYMCKHMLDNFLTKSVDKMVGYAVAQSRLYGLKTERYNTLKTVVETIDRLTPLEGTKVEEHTHLLAAVLQLDHVQKCMIENARGGSELAPAIDVCGKKFPYTNTWATVRKSLQKSLDNYGDRVKMYDGEGVDWKALSHAIRITEQVLELSEHGVMTFPRPNAEFLRAVKLGQVPLQVAMDYLTECFNKVDSAVEKSVLKERTDRLAEEFTEWKVQTLRSFYLLNLS